jgi:hypothetical protein
VKEGRCASAATFRKLYLASTGRRVPKWQCLFLFDMLLTYLERRGKRTHESRYIIFIGTVLRGRKCNIQLKQSSKLAIKCFYSDVHVIKFSTSGPESSLGVGRRRPGLGIWSAVQDLERITSLICSIEISTASNHLIFH